MKHKVSEAFGVVTVHVSKEDGVKLPWCHVKLRKPLIRAAPRVELNQHGPAIIRIVAEGNECAGARLSLEHGWAALGARQCYYEAWSGLGVIACGCRVAEECDGTGNKFPSPPGRSVVC